MASVSCARVAGASIVSNTKSASNLTVVAKSRARWTNCPKTSNAQATGIRTQTVEPWPDSECPLVALPRLATAHRCPS